MADSISPNDQSNTKGQEMLLSKDGISSLVGFFDALVQIDCTKSDKTLVSEVQTGKRPMESSQ